MTSYTGDPTGSKTCPSCGVWDGHAKDCPLLEAARFGAVDHLTPKINQAVDWDDRKDLSSIWQDYTPLPAVGLTEGTYDALLAIAKWGARAALEQEAGNLLSDVRWCGAGEDHLCHFWAYQGALHACAGSQHDSHRLAKSLENPDPELEKR